MPLIVLPARSLRSPCFHAGAGVLLLLMVALVWSGCAAPALSRGGEGTAHAGGAVLERRFDRVERLVRARYYSRDFNGVDWAALCERHRPLAAAAVDDADWYRIVNGMLRELRDAHTRAHRPEEPSRAKVREDRANAPARVEVREAQVLPDGIVYVRFDRFDADTVRWLERTVASHAQAPGMIVDLRDNHGGLVLSAQRAVGLFFPRRVPMGWVVGRNGRRTTEYSRPSRRTSYSGPLAVLVGSGSHSSAEVFAGVMQDHARAMVIGQTTAGEVLGARPYRLPDGGRLYVSVSDFQRLDGRRLEGAGVQPDLMSPTDFTGPALDGRADPTVVTARGVLRSVREPNGISPPGPH